MKKVNLKLKVIIQKCRSGKVLFNQITLEKSTLDLEKKDIENTRILPKNMKDSLMKKEKQKMAI